MKRDFMRQIEQGKNPLDGYTEEEVDLLKLVDADAVAAAQRHFGGSDWTRSFDLGLAASEQSRLKSAKACWQQALECCSVPHDRGLILYNLGVLNWARIGDGEEARRHFVDAVTSLSGAAVVEKERQMKAFACENLMYLCLSYDEYESWAEQVRKDNPASPILSGHVPHIKSLRDRGIAWSTSMRMIAEPLFDAAHPEQDLGKYGEAACIYNLMLTNRRALRVSKDDWRYAVSWFTRLRIRLVTTAGRKVIASGAEVPLSEYVWIAGEAGPWLEEYLHADPLDEGMLKLQEQLRGFLHGLQQS